MIWSGSMYRPTTVLYDPDCSICVATAAWLARRVPPTRLRLLPLTEAPTVPSVRDLVEGRSLAEWLHVVLPDGRVATGARAVLAAGRLVRGWGIAAAVWDNSLGGAVLEPVYREVSRKRRRIGRALGLPAT